MSAFFGYKYVGLFQTDQFHSVGTVDDAGLPVLDPATGIQKTHLVQNSDVATQDGAAPGLLKYADTNGDGKITPEDRTFFGNPNPKLTYGVNLAFTYKAFDLTAFLQGSYGNDVINWNRWWTEFWPSFAGQKSSKLLTDSWTPDRPNATIPMATSTSNFSTNTVPSSYLMEKGSYARLKNLQLGYTLPESLMSKINVKALRVYVQAVNLFTITKYSGLDPEIDTQKTNGVTDDRERGVDYGSYPTVKQYIIGLNLTF
jgi:hypothetical protein